MLINYISRRQPLLRVCVCALGLKSLGRSSCTCNSNTPCAIVRDPWILSFWSHRILEATFGNWLASRWSNQLLKNSGYSSIFFTFSSLTPIMNPMVCKAARHVQARATGQSPLSLSLVFSLPFCLSLSLCLSLSSAVSFQKPIGPKITFLIGNCPHWWYFDCFTSYSFVWIV